MEKKLFKVTFSGEAMILAEDRDKALLRAIHEVSDDMDASGIQADYAEEVTEEAQIPEEWKGCIPFGLGPYDDDITCEECLKGGAK